jgi:hypothetical protein
MVGQFIPYYIIVNIAKMLILTVSSQQQSRGASGGVINPLI